VLDTLRILTRAFWKRISAHVWTDKTDVNFRNRVLNTCVRVEKHVSEPWFSQIAASVKRWREAVAGEFASLSKNDTIVWVNEDFGFKRTVRTKVTFVKSTTFRKYCKPRGWTRLCLHMG
jgi:membrane-associated protease RseP (regulator of RpoE activity)